MVFSMTKLNYILALVAFIVEKCFKTDFTKPNSVSVNKNVGIMIRGC